MALAAILDCAGTRLTSEEKSFFKGADPFGFILFARNCEDLKQVKALVAEMKEAVGRDAPILIDQEGGRVARLRPPHWRACPAAGAFASLAERDAEQACEAVYLNARLMAQELAELGINVDCAPVADLLMPGAHGIIGDRAYGSDPEQVAMLAGEMSRGLMEGGVIPVMKHIPGHGRARVDSHEALPVVDAPLAELQRTDFVPFKKLSHLPMAMTAHVVYTALDPERMATLSPTVIRFIREELGFQGLLMSDDIAMKAMQGSFAERGQEALRAGCDVVLFCNRSLKEQQEVAEGMPAVTSEAEARLQKAFAALSRSEEWDMAAAEARLHEMLKLAA